MCSPQPAAPRGSLQQTFTRPCAACDERCNVPWSGPLLQLEKKGRGRWLGRQESVESNLAEEHASGHRALASALLVRQ